MADPLHDGERLGCESERDQFFEVVLAGLAARSAGIAMAHGKCAGIMAVAKERKGKGA